MAQRVDGYRAELRDLKEWEPYLKKHSGLPGPRSNLVLVQAVGEEADPDRLWRLSASTDEFLALCGTADPAHITVHGQLLREAVCTEKRDHCIKSGFCMEILVYWS